MWQRLSAILLMPLAACSQVLGINDVEINDAGPSSAHYDGIHYGYVIDNALIQPRSCKLSNMDSI